MPKTEIKFLFSGCHWWEFIAYGEIKPIPVSSKYLSRKQPLSSSQSSFPSSQSVEEDPALGPSPAMKLEILVQKPHLEWLGIKILLRREVTSVWSTKQMEERAQMGPEF